jgi:Uma2 family endonuclease
MTTLAEPHLRRWTREEYYKMADMGLFDGQRVELIEGQVIEMSPIGAAHMTLVTLVSDLLKEAFGLGYFIRVQGPLNLDAEAQPQPDLAVIAGKARDYMNAHPTSAVLVVEVADSSLTYDQTTKATLYAEAGIPEYWIVNVSANQLEVYHQPHAIEGANYSSYGEHLVLTAGDTVTPLARPEVQISVAEMLP